MRAALKQKKGNQINLLPRDKFASSTMGRVLGWLLTTFRIIVILVEMVVMGAFLSRFWLDAKNADLNDEISQKKALILASQDFETEFKATQARLKILTSLTKNEQSFSNLLTILTPLVPNEIVLESFSANERALGIVGTSPSEQEIAQFITNLESSNKIEKVYLTELGTNRKNEALLEFNLNVITKKEN